MTLTHSTYPTHATHPPPLARVCPMRATARKPEPNGPRDSTRPTHSNQGAVPALNGVLAIVFPHMMAILPPSFVMSTKVHVS